MKNKTYTKKFFEEAGRKGGISTAKKGKEFYKNIGKLGAKKRWGKEDIEPITPL